MWKVSALFTLVAILQQLPGTYLRAVLSKRARGEADVGLERAGEAKLPVFQEWSDAGWLGKGAFLKLLKKAAIIWKDDIKAVYSIPPNRKAPPVII